MFRRTATFGRVTAGYNADLARAVQCPCNTQSSTGWVKRRKEQREREKREREEREAKEKEESEKQAKDTNVGGVKNGESGDSVEKLSKNELPTSPSVVEADV